MDRVRVPDTSSYDFGGPGRGSGWRHRSLSNIDLTSQSKHSFTKQTKGYTSGLYDLYSRLETNDIENSENPYGNLSPTNGESQMQSRTIHFSSFYIFLYFFFRCFPLN